MSWQMAIFQPLLKGSSSPVECTQNQGSKCTLTHSFQVPGAWLSVQYYNSLFPHQLRQSSFILEKLPINIRVCGWHWGWEWRMLGTVSNLRKKQSEIPAFLSAVTTDASFSSLGRWGWMGGWSLSLTWLRTWMSTSMVLSCMRSDSIISATSSHLLHKTMSSSCSLAQGPLLPRCMVSVVRTSSWLPCFMLINLPCSTLRTLGCLYFWV